MSDDLMVAIWLLLVGALAGLALALAIIPGLDDHRRRKEIVDRVRSRKVTVKLGPPGDEEP